jgi:peroxiredoxin
MMTPQQAFWLFAYADWAMLLVGLAALIASICWGIYAILPRNKGRRKRTLRTALICFLIFTMFLGTQMSVVIPFFNHDHWTSLLIVLFVLPVLVLLPGLISSVVYGTDAILRRTGTERRQRVLKSLFGVVVFGVGVAPHTVAILSILTPLISAEDHSNHQGTLANIGDRIPDFECSTVEGSPFHTVDLRGKVIVLNFFATWCGPCQSELPHLQAIWDEFGSDGDFRMLVVGRHESDDVVKAFQHEHGFTFPVASDPDASVCNKFASQYIPRTYLISRQGAIIYEWTGSYEADVSKLTKLLGKELAKKH